MALLDRIRRRRDASRTPVPFVVGMNRSGTTLLRMMLDAHPQLTIPPETHFVPDLIDVEKRQGASPELFCEVITSQREWGDFGFDEQTLLARLRSIEKLDAGSAIRAFFELYAERQGKPRWGDKTPRYVSRMRAIERALPEARFVHVIRDGRDVALSVLDRTVKDLTVAAVAGRWKEKVAKARRNAPRLRHYLEVRYEDLILDPEGTLKAICEFAELPWDEAMLDYHERAGERLAEMARELPADGGKTELSVERRMATHAKTREPPDPKRVGRWREGMSDEQRAEFEGVAGELLAELGYPVGAGAAEAVSAQAEARLAAVARSTGNVGGDDPPSESGPPGPEDGAPADGPIGSAYREPQRPSIPKRAWLAGGDAVQRFRSYRNRQAGGPPAPFVVSATRSGSTLMRLMLDSHPQMAIPLETHFVPDLIKARRWERADADRLAEVVTTHRRWGDFHLDADEVRRRFRAVEPLEIGEVIRAFYRYYAEAHDKPRWGDKTPGYVREMLRIEHVLPEAHFIHLIRDGRDVALSVLGMDWGPDTVEGAARRWRKRVLRGREQAARLPHYIEVRYEDLILDTEPTLRRVCEYLELDFDPAMLRYYERAEERLAEKARDLYRGPDRPAVSAEHRLRSHALAKEPPKADRVYRWREKMTPEQRAEFEAEAADLLADLGYEVEGAQRNGPSIVGSSGRRSASQR
jgi:hypothetical protein